MDFLHYVNIRQGTASEPRFSTGNTLPLVATPWGMNAFALQTNEAGTDEWRIVYHRRVVGDLEAGHRVLCMDKLVFDGDEILPVTMT